MSLFGKPRHAATAGLPVEGSLPGFEGATGWLNSPPLTEADLRREGRPDRLLDVHLHQLAAHARLRPRVGREVRGSGAGRRRRPHARVPVRAGPRQRPRSRARTCASSTRSRSTATTPSGTRSPTGTGPPSTSPTRKGESGTTSSARADTTSANGSSSSCCARPGREGIGDDLVSVAPDGFEAQADWTNLGSPETYLGYQQAQNFASPGGAALDEPRTYVRARSAAAQPVGAGRGLDGREGGPACSNRADGRIAFRFHARDVNLVLRPRDARHGRCRSACSSTESLPAPPTGSTSTSKGHGTLMQPRLYQLVRQQGSIADRTFEITFLAPGVEAYVFTFG